MKANFGFYALKDSRGKHGQPVPADDLGNQSPPTLPDNFRPRPELVLTISDCAWKMSDMEKRQLYLDHFNEFLGYEQMLFVTGPRQAGKTTLAKMLGEQFAS